MHLWGIIHRVRPSHLLSSTHAEFRQTQPLPELDSATAVHNLDGHSSRKYFKVYYSKQNFPSVNIRAKIILRGIGCVDASRVGT